MMMAIAINPKQPIRIIKTNTDKLTTSNIKNTLHNTVGMDTMMKRMFVLCS